ncbi:MAG TPA: polysaccharide lyase [Planctomycetes bacterium]|nr:polysaccharide lyase [Planctomycetota bacterium]
MPFGLDHLPPTSCCLRSEPATGDRKMPEKSLSWLSPLRLVFAAIAGMSCPFGPWLVALILSIASLNAARAGAPSVDEASEALRRAVEFFHKEVAAEGGYLWRYSEDLTKREGEGRASATTVWVQPPGTPAVGMALLEAYRATGQAYLLEAARDAGYCLVRGQLRSGGWDYRIELDPSRRRRYAYRVDPAIEGRPQRNTSTLDDNTTQSALRFLMALDETLERGDPKIHEAVRDGLDRLVAVQYPNGAWPQRFERPPDRDRFPVKRACYPESWSRTWPGTSYAAFYTVNDNAINDAVDVMWRAWRTYGDLRYRAAAERAGQFILLAQMPDPQPAWAQQYDADMHPAWARKFEPPAVTGGESQGVLQALLQMYRETGDQRYLEPIPRALHYLRRSQLPDGRLARFYELKTNRPLYFTKKYELTYRDDDLPTHYAFKVGHNLDGIQRRYERLRRLRPEQLKPQEPSRPGRPSAGLIAQVRAVIASLDKRGRWVEDGRLRYHGDDDPTRRIIDCSTFITNVGILSRYVAAASP